MIDDRFKQPAKWRYIRGTLLSYEQLYTDRNNGNGNTLKYYIPSLGE